MPPVVVAFRRSSSVGSLPLADVPVGLGGHPPVPVVPPVPPAPEVPVPAPPPAPPNPPPCPPRPAAPEPEGLLPQPVLPANPPPTSRTRDNVNESGQRMI